MKLIKLDAIDSTNDFLKALAHQQNIENFTVVVAQNQTNGKGQHGTNWLSETGKNLTTSILIKNTIFQLEDIFTLNIAIAIAIAEALKGFYIPNISIKWPNDIMSGSKKIAGILIENLIKENGTIESVVGIGVNCNQTNFNDLPKASSLKNIMDKDFDLDQILQKCIISISHYIEMIQHDKKDILWNIYHDFLYKKGVPVAFEDGSGNKFMGIIKEVNKNGKLVVLHQDDSYKAYGIKQIVLL